MYRYASVVVVALIVLAIMLLPILAISDTGDKDVWRLFSSERTGFYPGQLLVYGDTLIVPFSDPAKYFVGILFIDKSTLKLKDYHSVGVDWSPMVFKSFLVDNKIFVMDRRGYVFVVDPSEDKITGIYMLVNTSRSMRLLISDAVVDGDGYLYIVSWGGRYYAYSTISKFKWNGSGFDKVWSSEVDVWNLPGNLLIRNGKLFFITMRGVYVFDKDSGEITASKRFTVREPYEPKNFTMWWDNNGLNILAYLHNKTMSTSKHDLTVHLVLDPENLDEKKEETLVWADLDEPARLCHFMYIDYPFVAGGNSLACSNPARIIDVEEMIVGWFKPQYYLRDKGVLLRTYTASTAYDEENLYIAVRADTFRFDTLLLFKAPRNLYEIHNNTLLGTLMTVYRLKPEPSNYISLRVEPTRTNHPDYITVKRVQEKHYKDEDIGPQVYQTLNPETEATTTTSQTTTIKNEATTMTTTLTTKSETTKTTTQTVQGSNNTETTTGTQSFTTLNTSGLQTSVTSESISTKINTENRSGEKTNAGFESTSFLYMAVAVGIVISIVAIAVVLKKK